MPNSIRDCVEKLVATSQIGRKVADDALALYDRMNNRYSAQAGPASAEAAAALATARALRQGAAEKAARIANDVRAFTDAETRVLEHPYGRKAGLMALMTKDMWRGGGMMRSASDAVKGGLNVDYLHQIITQDLFNQFGAALEAYKPGFLASAEKIQGTRNMVHEIFGAETGDQTAKVATAGWKKAADAAEKMAKGVGKVFEARENFIPQHWTPERVAKFTEQEYVDAYRKEIDSGAIQLWDRDTGKPATANRQDFVLRRAYNDIKGESGSLTPFSNQMRTFQFQPGKDGADSFLRMQGKFGVGDDILAMLSGHLDHMAQEIALSRVLGNNHQATFSALMTRVKQQPELPIGPGAERFNPARALAIPLQTEAMLRATYKVITGASNVVRSEVMSSVVGGLRDLIGASSLRNLSISIIPSDTVTTLLAANHLGMSGFKVLGELVDGTTSKEAAAHLMINAHSTMDFVNNGVRKYEDEINFSGIARKLTRGTVKATGADWWTTSGRRSAQTSMINQIAEMGKTSYGDLPENFRKNFLQAYGFDEAQWDKIRAVAPVEVNGAKYYLNPDALEPALYERLLGAVKEQSSYLFHQPDARTRAVSTGGLERGTASGEVWRSMMQFKQFAVERMTTHLMRILIDGPIENRIARGVAFMTLSTAAGAVSLQAAAIAAGKNPLDMNTAKFWTQAYIKGGAGGLYGDLLAAGIRGDRSAADVAAEFTGPLPGLAADAVRLAGAPIRAELDDSGRPKKHTLGRELVTLGKRNTPNTFYTKLAIDRLWWDKLQTLVDPDYRGSFRRAEQYARKEGSGFWWAPGSPSPGH